VQSKLDKGCWSLHLFYLMAASEPRWRGQVKLRFEAETRGCQYQLPDRRALVILHMGLQHTEINIGAEDFRCQMSMPWGDCRPRVLNEVQVQAPSWTNEGSVGTPHMIADKSCRCMRL
jgi:hypothetical protein